MSDYEERAEGARRERAQVKRRTPAKCTEHRVVLCPACFILTDEDDEKGGAPR